MRKNVLYATIIAFFIIISVFTVFAKPNRTTKLFIDPPSVANKKLNIGDTFTVNVSVADIANLKGYEFRLKYNTIILDATDVKSSSFLSSSPYCIKRVISDPEGFIWIACMMPLGSEAGVTGNGILETITFKVTGTGESSLELYKTMLGDSDGNSITYSVENGYFRSKK